VALKLIIPGDEDSESIDPEKVLGHEVAMIPILLADRYLENHNTGEIDHLSLEQLYRQQEKYLLADSLHMNLYAPILGVSISKEESYGDYSVVRLSEAQQTLLSSTPHLSPHDARILGGATHALKFESVPAFAGGCGLYFAIEPHDQGFDSVDRFFEAASINSPSGIGYAQLLLEPTGWFGNMDRGGNATSVYVFRDYPTRLDRLPLHHGDMGDEELAATSIYFQKLSHIHPSVRVATRRLRAALSRDDDEDRIVDLCIGLEALLGGGSGAGEIVHKISVRAAAILSRSGWGRSSDILSAMKDVYTYRSKVVHGIPGPHKKQLLQLHDTPIHASRYALAALCTVLRTALEVDGFHPDKVDEMFVYSALDIAAAAAFQEQSDSDHS